MERNRYPKDLKEQVVQEVIQAGRGNVASVARRHGLELKLLSRWIRESKHKSWENTSGEAKKVTTYIPSPQEFKELETENDKLNQLLGEKDLEIAILRDLVKKVNPGLRTKLK